MSAPSPPLAVQPHASGTPGGATTPSADELLTRFLGYTSDAGLSLYPAQEEALLELFAGRHVVLKTPTGSGKSLVALGLLFKALAEGRRGFYSCPIKALVNEKFFDLCAAFGAENVGLMTGDAAVNRDAPIVCGTAEVLANTALRSARVDFDAVVMDEFHYYADRERGIAWQIPLLLLERTQFVLMSATLGDTSAIEQSLGDVTGRAVVAVEGRERPVPLEFQYRETPLHETLEELVRTGWAPVYVVHFTQRSASEGAQALTSVDLTSRAEKEALRAELARARFDTPFGKEIKRVLLHGVGVHHAGLLPKYRRLVERLAQSGQLKVVSGTDTLGVGVNIPIRTVVLTQLCKFDGEKATRLGVRDLHQISGRAGRKGHDDEGRVVVQAPEHVIENLKLAAKEAQGKKVVKQKPPTKGYVHWDRAIFERLVQGTPEPLESRFQITHGLLLNLLQADLAVAGGGYRRLVTLVARCHDRPVQKVHHLKQARLLARTLMAAGLVEHWPRRAPGGAPPQLVLRGGLQRDFSLHQTLSLFVLHALPLLDTSAETWPLDVLSVVEAIVEDPSAVLYRQQDALKTAKIAELKAQGVPYEERINQLDEVEWPKPLRDFLYGHFDRFRAEHPWVGNENVRPKSVARELLERFTSFNDYVREYGLLRSEGVLLRYLAQVYKTLVQTVPADARTDALEERIAELRTLVRGVDRSLFEEWEGLGGAAGTPLPAPPTAERPAALDADSRAFRARVRSELHALLRALASRDYEAASALLDDPDGTWGPDALEGALAPFWAEHAAIRVTPDARKPEHTRLEREAPGQYRAVQRMLDADGADDWFFECAMDVREPRGEGAPLLRLLRIGS